MTLPIIFIAGPTCIGKSKLALNIAKEINGEIINADSMQVYKELKILTARPSHEDLNTIPHHLYGHTYGKNRYNVSDWCNETIKILKKNIKKKIPSIIVGGTGLYIDTLLNGIYDIPKIPETYKQQSNKKLLSLGIKKFYQKVLEIDKISCKKISNKDTQRLKRIWEVYYSTGKKLSEWTAEKNKLFISNYDYLFYLFFPAREKIYKKVNNRFLKMINIGAIDEVKKLISLNLDPSLPIMKAHGVPEISQYLSGSLTLEQCITKGQQVTRNYVKRQITWWKRVKISNCSVFDLFPSKIDLEKLDFIKNYN